MLISGVSMVEFFEHHVDRLELGEFEPAPHNFKKHIKARFTLGGLDKIIKYVNSLYRNGLWGPHLQHLQNTTAFCMGRKKQRGADTVVSTSLIKKRKCAWVVTAARLRRGGGVRKRGN